MLTLNQYQEVHGQHESLFARMIHAVSVVNHLAIEEVEQFDSGYLITEFKKIKDKLSVKNTVNDSIEINSTKLDLINFKLIKYGQFIDIEYLIEAGYLQNIHLIASCLFLKHEGGEMTEKQPENIGKVNKQYRGQLIQELPAESIVGTCNSYLKFRDKFFDSYDLFQDPLEGVDHNDMTDEEKQVYNEEKKNADNNKRTQWMRILNTLSNNDITKFDAILDTNLFLVFNQFDILRKQKM